MFQLNIVTMLLYHCIKTGYYLDAIPMLLQYFIKVVCQLYIITMLYHCFLKVVGLLDTIPMSLQYFIRLCANWRLWQCCYSVSWLLRQQYIVTMLSQSFIMLCAIWHCNNVIISFYKGCIPTVHCNIRFGQRRHCNNFVTMFHKYNVPTRQCFAKTVFQMDTVIMLS